MSNSINTEDRDRYTESRDSSPMYVNAPDGESRQYLLLSGDSFIITARSAEEAEKKYLASLDGEACPCGARDCGCVEENEVLTHVEEA